MCNFSLHHVLEDGVSEEARSPRNLSVDNGRHKLSLIYVAPSRVENTRTLLRRFVRVTRYVGAVVDHLNELLHEHVGRTRGVKPEDEARALGEPRASVRRQRIQGSNPDKEVRRINPGPVTVAVKCREIRRCAAAATMIG